MPCFSILILVCNAPSFIATALLSVLNRSCWDYGVVLVDDGSTDGSGEICDDFVLPNAHVAVIHQENTGRSSPGEWRCSIRRGTAS